MTTLSQHELLDTIETLQNDFGVDLAEQEFEYAPVLLELLKECPDSMLEQSSIDKIKEKVLAGDTDLYWQEYPRWDNDAVDFLGLEVNETVRERYLDMKEIWADVDSQFERWDKITETSYLAQ